MKVTEFHAVSWGKERGERAREILWFFDTLQELYYIRLLYKHYILRLFLMQQTSSSRYLYIFSLKNSLSVGEMDL